MVEFSKKLYDAAITAGGKEGKAESIKNLISTMKVSIDQAMDILKGIGPNFGVGLLHECGST